MGECKNENGSRVLLELLELLELEKIEENLYRGQSQDLGFGAVFGGQVLGQALSAAFRTVPDERVAHSLHAYFLRPGDARQPIVYHVDRIRDGSSFTTRRIVAIQRGREICSVAASFQVVEDGFEHQSQMPETRSFEGLPSDWDLARMFQDRIPEPLRTKLICDKPIEIRPIDPVNAFKPTPRDPLQYAWLRAAGDLPDQPSVHQALLTYASDFRLIGTSLLPHAKTFWEPDMQVTSIDHSMWFHRPFRMDEWLLHAMDSPAAAGARGFNRGSVFTSGGVLVASLAQEGLIRQRPLKRDR
jgi:acyl-CoA thioesterase-2